MTIFFPFLFVISEPTTFGKQQQFFRISKHLKGIFPAEGAAILALSPF
jgi:hypothetical protein